MKAVYFICFTVGLLITLIKPNTASSSFDLVNYFIKYDVKTLSLQSIANGGSITIKDSPQVIEHMVALFDKVGLCKNNGVLPIYTQHLPSSITKLLNRDELIVRKKFFIYSILPLVVLANQKITQERQLVASAKKYLDIHGSLEKNLYQGIQDLQHKYRLPKYSSSKTDIAKALNQLLLRVDIVHPALALAVAIQETGWGQSRFLQEGNSLYSQVVAKNKGIKYIVAKNPSNNNVAIRVFNTLQDAVDAFMLNLNTQRNYAKFRILRAQKVDLTTQIHALTNYAEQPKYSISLLNVINANKLIQYGDYKLIIADKMKKPLYINYK